MKPRIYLDTTVISYLTAKPGRDAVSMARQLVTLEWWGAASDQFELVVSEFVLEEARSADPAAADRRLDAIKDLASLSTDHPDIEMLANALTLRKALPATARFDALHIAAAACNGIPFLLTWNYKHLANPVQLDFVEQVCTELGYKSPRIVTPDQFDLQSQGDKHVD